MSLFKKKRKKTREEELAEAKELLEKCRKLREWESNPNRSYKDNPFTGMTDEEIYQGRRMRQKLERRYEVMDSVFSTIRDIILTPLAPIFGIIALAAKVIMYGSALSFLYACYKVYKYISGGDGFIAGLKAEWYFFILPFAAAFLYFIFDKFSEYCSDHSLY